ncbi:oxygenase MpaB family protein [Nocardia sp. NPDC051030]|uniref:oxygenase MpaB family protein n=1 Tax=Nocardia sp. NPDC051030 TaxID=3155162 RepID=UPI003431FDF3
MWQVWSHPAAILGQVRTAIVQDVYPPIAAAVDQHDPMFVRIRRHGRYMGGGFDRFRRSLSIPATCMFGSRAEADLAASHILRFHTAMTGPEPVTGTDYVAGDPRHMLYAGLTAAHSALLCYEIYGPGRLCEKDRDRYFEEWATLMELVGVPSELVIPATSQQVREYFDSLAPSLCVTEAARPVLDLLFKVNLGELLHLDRHAPERIAIAIPLRIVAAAGLALTPRRIRDLVGVDQSVFVDGLVIGGLRPLLRVMSLPALNDAVSRISYGPDLARRQQTARRTAAMAHRAPRPPAAA